MYGKLNNLYSAMFKKNAKATGDDKAKAHEFVENEITECKKIVPQELVDLVHLQLLMGLTFSDSPNESKSEVNDVLWKAVALGFAMGKSEQSKKDK